MKTYVVKLDPHDDILSAKDKIAWSKAARVLLIWPRKGKVLDRRVDLLLLQRACQQRGVQMAIVTRSGEVKAHARDLGIPVFANPVKAQSALWLRRGARARQLPLILEANGPRRPVDPALIRAQRDALAGPKNQPGRSDQVVRLAAFLVGVLAFLALVLFFAPGARVELKPQREMQRLTIPVWASLSLRVPNPSGGVPAHLVTAVIEGRDQGQSTGQTRVADGTASGQVQLTNLTAQPVEVPAGSVALTLGDPPVYFVTTQAVTVPAAGDSGGASGGGAKNGSTDGGAKGSDKNSTPASTGQGSAAAQIRAVSPGSAGNVGAEQIRAMEGPLGLRLAVNNPQPTRGGTDRSAPAPSSADYQSLKDKLLTDLQANALDELRGRLKAGQRLLEPTLAANRVIEETHQPQENQPAEQFQLVLRVEYTAWVVEEADLRAVSQAALEANRVKDFQPTPDSLRIDFASAPEKAEGTSGADSVRWTLSIERTLEAGWSQDQMVQQIQGRPVGEAVNILRRSLRLAEAPRINLYPSWWGWLPFLPFRIQMVTS